MIRHLHVLTVLLMVAGATYAAPPGLKPPSEADIAKMEAAMPSVSTVKPAKPRKLLIFSHCEGFKHSSIPFGEKAFEIMGRKTGAFTTTVADDCAILESPELDTFDAILMNNTTMRLPLLNIDTKGMDEKQKAAADEREAKAQKRFLDFVRNGKGLIGIHAATDCLYKWAEYGELMGGFFWGHPWNENVGVKLDDPGHPLLKAFNGLPFVVADEIYQFREPYSRDKLRVLLSIDVTKTNMDKESIRRKDGDFAVAWIREYGKGRGFFFSLGHRHEIFWNPAVMQCYLDGIQYAFGDLNADATPSSQLSPEYLAESKAKGLAKGLVNAFAELSRYTLDDSDRVPQQVANLVIDYQATPGATRDQIAQRLAALAADPDATSDSRVFACRQLRLIAGDAVVPTLVQLLTDDSLRHPARMALEAIPGTSVGTALLKALPGSKGLARAALIESIGQRRVVAATSVLTEDLGSKAPVVAEAAANALGRIGGREAAEALLAARGDAAQPLVRAVDRTILACAESARLAGNRETATTCYGALLASNAAPHVRAGAVYGQAVMIGAPAAEKAIEALRSEEREIAQAGARLVLDLPGEAIVPQTCRALSALPAINQVLAIDSLAARGDRRAQEAVLALVEAESVDIQAAALRALESLGDAKSTAPIVRLASDEDATKKVRDAARQALNRMTGAGVDQALINAMAVDDTEVKTECARAFGARKARVALPVLYQSVLAEDRKLAKESCKALSALCQTSELPKLVDLIIETSSGSVRAKLENTLVNVARRTDDENTKVSTALAGLGRSPSKPARTALLTALGKIGAKPALPTLVGTLKDPDGEIQRAAVKALADHWPTAEPILSLRTVSREAKDLVLRVLALRGYARMLALPNDRPMSETLKLYDEALGLAKGDQEKRTLIAGLGRLAHPDALTAVKRFLQDKAVQEEALMSALSIMKNLGGESMTFDASAHARTGRNAVDGNPKTRWTTGRGMRGGEWFQVRLAYETQIKEVFLDAGPVGHDQPRGWEVYVSRDGDDWGEPVATGGDPKKKAFTITFPPKEGRYVKIVQTGGPAGNFWSVNEIRINGLPDLKALSPIPSENWKVSAARSHASAPPENAIDGDLTKRWGTGGGMKPTDWFMVDMGAEYTVHKVVMDAAKSRGDYPREYRIYSSLDGQEWFGPIGTGKGEKALVSAICLPTRARYVRIAQLGDEKRMWWSMYDLKIIGE